ncbi:ribokinase [Streptomyces sp. NPDC020917]|uniref:ribokinase n=1 Tax=Streptomyces sp. NPDC020917 TaxID=3365102 RepID=UPI0037AD76F0
MRNGQVVVVGSANWDRTVVAGRLPLPGETVLGRSVQAGAGGKGANQAVAAARAGARCRLVATVGDDTEGRELRRRLDEAGVDTDVVRSDPARPTGAALVTVDDGGENTIVVVPGANAATDATAVRAAAPLLRGADVVVAQAEIPAAAIEEAVLAGARLFVLNLAPYTPLARGALERVDVLVVNATEAGQVLGAQPPAGVAEALAAADRLAGLARSAVITLGGLGAVVSAGPQGGGARHVPAPRPARVVDTTGAGDAFVGVLAARLAAGEDLPQAVSAGVRAATLSVATPGAASSYPDFTALPEPGSEPGSEPESSSESSPQPGQHGGPRGAGGLPQGAARHVPAAAAAGGSPRPPHEAGRRTGGAHA